MCESRTAVLCYVSKFTLSLYHKVTCMDKMYHRYGTNKTSVCTYASIQHAMHYVMLPRLYLVAHVGPIMAYSSFWHNLLTKSNPHQYHLSVGVLITNTAASSEIINKQKKTVKCLWLTECLVLFLFFCLLVVIVSIRSFMLPRCAVFSAFSFSSFSFCSRRAFCRRFFSRRSRSLSVVVRSLLPINSRFCFTFTHIHCPVMSYWHI